MSVSSGIEEEITPTIHDNYTRSCSNDSDCGYDQHVQYTEMIFAKSSDNGKYFLKVLAVYGNESKESCNTAYKYIIEEHDNERIDISPLIRQVVGGVVVCSVAITFLFDGYFVLKHLKQQGNIKLKLREQYAQKIIFKKRDTSTKPLLAQQDNSRIGKPEEEREITTNPQKRVKDLDQKSSPEHDTSTKPLLAQQDYSRIGKPEEQRETTTNPQKRVKGLDQKSSPEHDTSCNPLLAQQDNSRIENPEEEKETTANQQKRVKDLDQKSSPEHDTSSNPLLAEQDNSRIGKPEEERETTTNPNKDKLLPNEKDMERSKKIFENRRHTH